MMVVFDILCKSLLDNCFGDDGEGSVLEGFNCKDFLDFQSAALKESINMAMNPFRRLNIWSKERRDGIEGLSKLRALGRRVIEKYRLVREKRGRGDEQNQAVGILSHLIAHPYPSEEHRISDFLIFLIAGLISPL